MHLGNKGQKGSSWMFNPKCSSSRVKATQALSRAVCYVMRRSKGEALGVNHFLTTPIIPLSLPPLFFCHLRSLALPASQLPA